MVQERNNVELSRAAVAGRALVGRAVAGRRERYVLSLAFVDACQTIAQIAKLRRMGRPCILTKLDRPFERRRSLVESMLIDIEIRKRGEIARRLYPIRLGMRAADMTPPLADRRRRVLQPSCRGRPNLLPHRASQGVRFPACRRAP